MRQTGLRPTAQPRYLPDPNRLSVLAATILLAYALARFVNLPVRDLSVQLPGLYLAVQINVRTIVALLVAGLTASGADWLMRGHPGFARGNTLEHWLLPALTALVIGLPLFQLPLGLLWWGGFILGGALLILVLVAEFITLDEQDMRQPTAAAGLTAVSFALFLVLAASLRFANLRLFLILPALALAAWLVSLRSLHLRLHGLWAPMEAGVAALVVAEMAAALQYWSLSPVSYGLALLGPAYALTSLIAGLSEGQPLRQAVIEPAIVLALVWGVAVWVR